MSTYPDVNDRDMRGSARVRNRIINSLVTKLPDIQARMRQQWNQTEQDFPTIENYDEGEPRSFANDQAYALVVVNVGSANNFTTADYDASAAEAFRVRYQVRLYTYVKTASVPEHESAYARCVRLRDMTTTLVRSGLLTSPSFGTDDMRLVHSTISEQYSDFTKAKGNRWIGGVYHSFDVEVDEQLVLPLLGEAQQFRIETNIERGPFA